MVVEALAVLSQKGGAGKSTLALGLAVAHELAGGHAALLDLDVQQATAAAWGRLRGHHPPKVSATPPQRLRQVLDALRSDTDLIVIDGPPRERAGGAEAARLADLVLIPCRPAAPDLIAIPPTLELTRSAGTRAVVVLNACPARGQWTSQAADAIREAGAELCPVTIGARIAHGKAFMLGRTAQETEPNSLAAAEVAALYRWLETST
jgi:chromosome partitioning protein